MERREAFSDEERAFLADARRATLATTTPEGRPRLVPICFVVGDAPDRAGRPLLYSPLDEKPKRTDDPHRLARVQDILVLPEASILVDRWSEDWSHLAWLRAEGTAELLEPQPHERDEHAAAVKALRAKYPQYREQAIDDRPIIRIALNRIVSWGNLVGGGRKATRRRRAT
ncbi:MAG TPA: TIGR03668 family PPOX class F420-dependent oxidoreductase [Candidatus Limnocylindrales bacterium]|nr:TIGR03668 family PPOX class F420-dependent oxidoreductase [Candidatus Limnocylindrales bacterium]